jgi:large subunit ribosomal protein L23
MNAERLMMVLREPHTSEKATILADKLNQITFKVLQTATKREIKLAVEQLFKVQVQNVSIVNVKGKVKRFKQTIGKRNNWKKAFVTLKAGEHIDFSVSE